MNRAIALITILLVAAVLGISAVVKETIPKTEGSLIWATRAGGSTEDRGYGIAVLPDGSCLTTGLFYEAATFGLGEENETTVVSAGYSDIFLAKYNSDGTLAWATRAGGDNASADDVGYSVAALGDGSGLVVGYFSDVATFGPGELNETTLSSAGDWDAFLAKYDPDGLLVWAKRAGGTGHDAGQGIAAFSDGSAVISGHFQEDADFGLGEANETILTSAGGQEIFLAKYNPDGTLAWAKSAGDGNHDTGRLVASLADGGAVVTGYYQGTPTFGAGELGETTLPSADWYNFFVARYSSDGTLVWAKHATNAFGHAIASLADGSALATAYYSGTAVFGAGEPNETTLASSGSYYDIFIAKYNPDGTLAWAKSAGSAAGSDAGHGIASLPDGGCLVSGEFGASAVFGLGEPNQTTLTSAGELDVFVAKYAPDGALDWAIPAGGAQTDHSFGVAYASDNGALVAGHFQGEATFGEEPSWVALSSAGAWDIFVAKFVADQDSDGDGLPDEWEATYGLDPFDDGSTDVSNGADGDPDSDGLINLDEYQNNSDPNDADSDDDGLTDGDEVNTQGTDPLDEDSDGDGMPDGWEVAMELEPLVDDAAEDPDADGLANIEEYQAGTNPHVDNACTAPDPPSGVSATDGLYDVHVEITWEPAEGASEYQVYRNAADSAVTAAAISPWISDTTYADTTAALSSIHYYWVKARNNCGESELSVPNSGYRGALDPAIADFSAQPRSGAAPLTVAFTDRSIPGAESITGWQWGFGDGGTSAVQNPTHTYEHVGVYDVTLTLATTGADVFETKLSYVNVTGTAFPDTVYVDDDGDDANEGTQTSPWATIGYAMAQVAEYADETYPVTVQVAAGVYNEKVVLAPYVSLIGAGSATTVIQHFSQDEPEHIVILGADHSGLANCKVTLPGVRPVVTCLIWVRDVSVQMDNLVLDGAYNQDCTGLLVSGVNSSDSFIRNSLITHLRDGVYAIDSGINISRNRFRDLRGDAVFVVPPGRKADETGATPLLGSAENVEGTGFNVFRNIGEKCVVNNNPAETVAEYNDWGAYTVEEIQEKVSGPVDFEPFLRSEVLPEVVYVLLCDAATEQPVSEGAAPWARLDGSIEGVAEGSEGLFTFVIGAGSYSLEAGADCFQTCIQTLDIELDVLAQTPVIEILLEPEDEGETQIGVSPSRARIRVGASVQLTASSTDPEDDSFTWTSTSPAAAVNDNGTVTGQQKGTADITATGSHSGGSGSARITVACGPIASGVGNSGGPFTGGGGDMLVTAVVTCWLLSAGRRQASRLRCIRL